MSDREPNPTTYLVEPDVARERVDRWWYALSRRRVARRASAHARPWQLATAACLGALLAAVLLRPTPTARPARTWADGAALTREPLRAIAPRVLALADGARLELAAGSLLTPLVDDGRTLRLLLDEGTATLDVPEDAAPSWTVETGMVRVDPLGARLVLRRSAERVEVDVHEGVVLVESALLAPRVQRLVGPTRLVVAEATSGRVTPAAAATTATATIGVESSTADTDHTRAPLVGRDTAEPAAPDRSAHPRDPGAGAPPEPSAAPTPPPLDGADEATAAISPTPPIPSATAETRTISVPAAPSERESEDALRTALAESDSLRAVQQLDAAAARLERALREHPLAPLVALTALTLARIHTRRGDAQGAVAALERALQADNFPATLEADARAQLEAAREATQSPEAAERWRRASGAR